MAKRERTAWRRKLHSAFFEVAEAHKRFEHRNRQINQTFNAAIKKVGPKASATDRQAIASRAIHDTQELGEWFETRLLEINAKYPELPHNPLAYSYLDGPDEETDDEKVLKFLHWARHGESLAKTLRDDAAGKNLDAWDKLARTGSDWRRVVHRIGGIKNFQDDEIHRSFLELVLCFTVESTNPLTENELAECADLYCGCGKREHDSSALRKQFRRLVKDLEASARPPDEIK